MVAAVAYEREEVHKEAVLRVLPRDISIDRRRRYVRGGAEAHNVGEAKGTVFLVDTVAGGGHLHLLQVERGLRHLCCALANENNGNCMKVVCWWPGSEASGKGSRGAPGGLEDCLTVNAPTCLVQPLAGAAHACRREFVLAASQSPVPSR